MGFLSFCDKFWPRGLQSASSPVEDERAWSSGSFKPSPLRASLEAEPLLNYWKLQGGIGQYWPTPTSTLLRVQSLNVSIHEYIHEYT